MVTATQSAQAQRMDTNERSSTSSHFENALRQKIVGQDEAVQAVAGELLFCPYFLRISLPATILR
jgi:ATP-dependent Clp protease ATP-binding subunit ClpA